MGRPIAPEPLPKWLTFQSLFEANISTAQTTFEVKLFYHYPEDRRTEDAM